MSNEENVRARKGMPIADLLRLAVRWVPWKYSYQLRRFARYTVTGVLAFSVAGSLWKFGVHLAAEYLAAPSHPGVLGMVAIVLQSPFQLLVIVLLVGLTLDHWEEAQKPRYEYAFVRSLCAFQLASKSKAHMTLAEALGHFYPVFNRARVDFLAVFLSDKEGNLTVAQNGIYPTDRTPESGYFPVLKLREGVGGLVAYDSVTRYMPWCSRFDSWWNPKNWEVKLLRPIPTLKRRPFPHALRFDFSKGSEARVDDFDPAIFKVSPAGGQEIPFRSLLCVPLARAGQSPGFLQMTFSKAKSLDLFDITMAVAIGLVLGEALDSLKVEPTRA